MSLPADCVVKAAHAIFQVIFDMDFNMLGAMDGLELDGLGDIADEVDEDICIENDFGLEEEEDIAFVRWVYANPTLYHTCRSSPWTLGRRLKLS